MRGRFSRLVVSLYLCLLVLYQVPPIAADVVVLANRTTLPVTAEVTSITTPVQRVSLAAGDCQPVYVDGRATVSFAGRAGAQRYAVGANTAHYFARSADGHIDLRQIGLGEDPSTANGRRLPGNAASAPPATITVKLFVDEEEPANQIHWQRRLGDRIAAASDVLETYANVRLKVVAFGTWDSDDATSDFFDSLAEFEREAKLFPAQLAIGFTSQYQVVQGRTHMAGTRGALHTHILVRDWSRQMSEPERLELLVHELGHYLGASHSPEPDSVMRPVLGNKQAVRKGFQVRFDPVNTLVMAMMGEELRRRHIQQLADATLGTKLRLRQIYKALAPTMPEDPAAQQFVARVSTAAISPLVLGTRQVVAQVVRSSQANLALPSSGDAPPGARVRRDGDALTEYYVRSAAGIARFLPEDIAGSALLLGLGIALDDSNVLREHPNYGSFAQLIESPSERALRLVSLGQPTLRGRRDLAQHFFVSAHLAAIAGSAVASSSGLAKEFRDSAGGSGFSFADLAANRAGILFAGGIVNKRISLPSIADGFNVATFMPTVDGLAEGLSAADLAAQFGPQTDDRFRRELDKIDQRLRQLPAYRGASVVSQR